MKSSIILLNILATISLWLPGTAGSSILSTGIRLSRGGSTPGNLESTDDDVEEKDVGQKYAWKQYSKWSTIAGRKRNEVRRTRRLKLRLTILGTALHTLGNNASILARKQTYNFAGSACLALVTLTVRQHLSKEDIITDVNSKILAESIKSEFFKSMVKVQPYSNPKKNDKLLIKKVESLENKYCLPHMAREAAFVQEKQMKEVSDISGQDHKQWYLENRLKPEIKRMIKKSRSCSRKNKYFTGLENVLTSAAALVGIVNNASSGEDGLAIVKVIQNRLGLWTPIIAAAATSIASYVESSNFEVNSEKGADVANKLQMRCDTFGEGAVPSLADFETLVNGCEDVLLKYTDGWAARMGGGGTED